MASPAPLFCLSHGTHAGRTIVAMKWNLQRCFAIHRDPRRRAELTPCDHWHLQHEYRRAPTQCVYRSVCYDCDKEVSEFQGQPFSEQLYLGLHDWDNIKPAAHPDFDAWLDRHPWSRRAITVIMRCKRCRAMGILVEDKIL